MNIYVSSAVGHGSTLLAAFDNALQNAGVHNYNLLFLSSVIPPGTKIIRTRKYKTPSNEFGNRLYAVEAQIRSSETGKFLAAGLGWYQLDDKRGFFVEHTIKGETKVAVESELKSLITNTLRDMCVSRKIKFSEKRLKSILSVAQIKDRPTCVLCIAVYQSQEWK